MSHTKSPALVYLAHPVRSLTYEGQTWTLSANMAAFVAAYKALRPIALDRFATLLAPWEHDVRMGQPEALTMVNVAKLVPRCDELWYVTYEEQGHSVSPGVDAEIEMALKSDIPVRHFRLTMAGDILKESMVRPIAEPVITGRVEQDFVWGAP
jgi:hypothetical protein